jgi:maltose O-acetyltransferase
MGAVQRVRSVLRDLGEDVRAASQHLVLVSWGGSVFLPRSGRRLLYRAMGAELESAPGASFGFMGDPHNLRVAENVYFNQRVFVDALGPVSVGAGSAFGMEVMILTSHHPVDADGRWQADAVGLPVSVGERVWVGARAVLLPGAVIESDVIVAGGAVVAGRCRAGGLYAGVPARRIRDHATGAA